MKNVYRRCRFAESRELGINYCPREPTRCNEWLEASELPEPSVSVYESGPYPDICPLDPAALSLQKLFMHDAAIRG